MALYIWYSDDGDASVYISENKTMDVKDQDL